jgi:hypothetical protein
MNLQNRKSVPIYSLEEFNNDYFEIDIPSYRIPEIAAQLPNKKFSVSAYTCELEIHKLKLRKEGGRGH